MSVEDEMLQRIQSATDAYDVLSFDGCPCFTLTAGDAEVEGNCWRTGPREVDGCSMEFNEAGRPLAEALKPLLDAMDWYGEWTLVAPAAVLGEQEP